MEEKAAFEIPLCNPPANSKAAIRMGSAALLVVGAIGIVWASSGLIKGRASTHWQPMPGKVLSFQRHSPAEGLDYPTIEYAFEFNGVQHRSSRIAFAPASEECQRLAGLVPGAPVTVYVNPERPTEAVLVTGASRFTSGGLAISTGLFLMGLCIPFISRVFERPGGNAGSRPVCIRKPLIPRRSYRVEAGKRKRGTSQDS